MNWAKDLTPVEAAVQGQQYRDHGCRMCLHRRYDGMLGGDALYSCRVDKAWKPGTRCKGFKPDHGE